MIAKILPRGRPYFPYPWAVHIFPTHGPQGPPQFQSKNGFFDPFLMGSGQNRARIRIEGEKCCSLVVPNPKKSIFSIFPSPRGPQGLKINKKPSKINEKPTKINKKRAPGGARGRGAGGTGGRVGAPRGPRGLSFIDFCCFSLIFDGFLLIFKPWGPLGDGWTLGGGVSGTPPGEN